eukprot:gene3979-4232_t
MFTDPLMPGMYDIADNFRTVKYTWDNGTWAGPDKQRQWWLGRRPPPNQLVDYSCKDSTECSSINPVRHKSVHFYFDSSDIAGSPRATSSSLFCTNLTGSTVPCNDLSLVSTAPPELPAANRGIKHTRDMGIPECPISFTPAPECGGIWRAAAVSWSSPPPNPNDWITDPAWYGWQWSGESPGALKDGTYDQICHTFFEDLLPPGIELSWTLSEPSCQWELDLSTLGPAATYPDADLAGANYSQRSQSWQYVKLQNAGTTNCSSAGFQNGDRCTLTVTPIGADFPACSRRSSIIPHGVPIVTCHRSSTPLLSITGTSHQFTVKFNAAGAASSVAATPTGLLPDVACHRGASSPRFGGRCAANVVQYLAYDEAYHTPEAQISHGFPEYGGCMAGGIMRHLADHPTEYDDNTYRSWFTAPLWPLEAWRSGGPSSDPAALNVDPAALNKLFKHQDAFKTRFHPGGCHRIRLGWDLDFNNCLTVRVVGTGKFDKSSAMLYKNLAVTAEFCSDPPDPNQCFQIDADFTAGVPFRIMQKDLCLVLPKSAKDAVRQQIYSNIQQAFLWRAPVEAKMLPCKDIASGASAQSHLWERIKYIDNVNGDDYFFLMPQYSRFDDPATAPIALAVDPDVPGGLAVVSTVCDQALSGRQCIPKDNVPYECLDNTLTCCECLLGIFNTNDGLSSPYSLLHSTALNIQVLDPAFPTYNALLKFWQNSFVSSAVDIRSHRSRFVPTYARQGPQTRGPRWPVPTADVIRPNLSYVRCNDAEPSTADWDTASLNNTWFFNITIDPSTNIPVLSQVLDAEDNWERSTCIYNVGAANNQNYMNTWLPVDNFTGQYWSGLRPFSDALGGLTLARLNSPYTGTTFMYIHGNKCHRMSGDIRLSMLLSPNAPLPTWRSDQGPEADKCSSRLGTGQYVEVEDLWSFMASDSHDPCGWPFIECVPECSLPSDPTAKGWRADDNDGYVYDDGAGLPVGCVSGDAAACLNPADPANAKIMKRPQLANKIGAIDWRNLTLYSANLDFDSFAGEVGESVWYL